MTLRKAIFALNQMAGEYEHYAATLFYLFIPPI